MNDVVERVADAIEATTGTVGFSYREWVVLAARAAIEAMRDQFDAGRFDQWQTRDLVAQCRMQARDNLDPEYTQFMDAVANRLAALADASPDIGKEGIGNDVR